MCVGSSSEQQVPILNVGVEDSGQGPVHRFQHRWREEWNGDGGGHGHTPVVQVQFHHVSLMSMRVD